MPAINPEKDEASSLPRLHLNSFFSLETNSAINSRFVLFITLKNKLCQKINDLKTTLN